MSSQAVQLSFNLRTSDNVRTVHLVGSWDTYKSQLPLSLVKDAKAGTWRGTFRFQGSNALKLGARYWYYYIVDGYHVSHDPSKEFTTEKTTGRKLNILDVPGGKPSADTGRRPTSHATSNSRHSRDIPVGRALSPSKIVHPKPTKAYASRGIREANYERSPIDKSDDDFDDDDDLANRFANARISDRGYDRHGSSPSDLSDSSGSGSGPSFSGGSSPSSLSSISNGSCRCERYGVTRSGQRVKLDCGGARCGYNSSDCSSSSSSDQESESEEEYRARVRKAELQRDKEKALEKARSGVKTDRHGKPVSSGSGASKSSSGGSGGGRSSGRKR